MALFSDPSERFLERDSSGNVIRTWSKLLVSGNYDTLPGPYILDAQAIRQDWTGSATAINGATGNPYSFIDQFTNLYTDIGQGRVVVPKGFPLQASAFTRSGRTDRYAADTVDKLNTNRLRIANFDEDSSGNYTGVCLGIALKDYYMPVYARQLSEIITVVDQGVIEIPFFQSTAVTGGRELARLVTKITAAAKNANTDTDFAIGDFVTVGTGVDRGRFIKIGTSNANSDIVGQVVAIERVDAIDGVRGWMQNKMFDPFFLFREGSWYTDYDITEAMTFPSDYNPDYVFPTYRWFGRGIRGLTDGAEYRVTVSDSATATAVAGGQDDFVVDIGPYAYTFAGAKICLANGDAVDATHPFTTADVTITAVTDNGADDLVAGGWVVSAVDDTTEDRDYGQHINVTFNRVAGNITAGHEVIISFSFLAKGQHAGLPVSLDDPSVAGILHLKLMLR